MKYFIFRGCEGFGDRLQCLSQAIQYCFTSGRILVIDWRDHHWTQGEYHSIYEYLTIKNTKTIDIKNFIDNHYHKKLSIFNEEWRDKLLEENTMKYMYNEKMSLPEKNKILQKIIKKKVEDFAEDIVVYNGVFFRVWNTKFLNFITFSSKVYDVVDEVYKKTNIKKKKYICVHIRATSKNWRESKNINKRLSNRMHEKFPDQSKYFEYIHNQIKNIKGDLPTLIVSDCVETANEWVSTYGKGEVVSNINIETKNKSGIHLVDLNDNEKISKHELNLLCLRDFCLMVNAKEIVSDGISLYSNMAKKLK